MKLSNIKNIYEHISLLKFKWHPLLPTELFNFVVSDLTTSHSPKLEACQEPVKFIPYSFLILAHLQNCFIGQLVKNIY